MPNVDELISQVKRAMHTARDVLDDSDWDDFYAVAHQELESCEGDRQRMKAEPKD